MKKLISSVFVCCACYGAKAQATTLVVNNTTPCPIAIIVKGGSTGCTISQTSVVQVIPASTSGIPLNMSMFGYPPGSKILAVDILTGPPPCVPGGPALRIGEPCLALAPIPSLIPVVPPSCTPCSSGVTATWVTAAPPGGTAILNLN